MDLPWIEPFLEPVRLEYARQPPAYRVVDPNDDDLAYMKGVAMENDSFDVLGFKKECWQAYEVGKAKIVKCESEHGSICLLEMTISLMKPQWNTWWRAIRLLSPKKPVRILLFAHPKKRELFRSSKKLELRKLGPASSVLRKLGPADVNGGATMPCNAQTIIVYRKEEMTRVMIHELLHASCSDPYHKDISELEADTEAWAELLLCAMAVKGIQKSWNRVVKEQIIWALRQEATVKATGQVKSKKDYAWRYLTGRLEVWRNLGFSIPSLGDKFEPTSSLRFTICEPGNI